MIKYCKYKGVGVLPYSPLASGDLARKVGADTKVHMHSLRISGYPLLSISLSHK